MYYHKYYNADALDINCLEFRMLSSEEIQKLSVVKIHTPITFDGLGYPVPGGLYDPKLGPLKFNNDPCATCGNLLMKCFGHYGHIELPLPVINPLFTASIINILRISCLNCYTIQIPPEQKYVLVGQLRLIDQGYINEAQSLEHYLTNNTGLLADEIKDYVNKYCLEVLNKPQNNYCKNIEDLRRRHMNSLFKNGITNQPCFNCRKPITKFKFQNHKIILIKHCTEKTYMMPSIIKDYMRELWKVEKDVLSTLLNVLNNVNSEFPTDVCFITKILITPSITRPIQFLNNKQIEHSKNVLYKLILQDCLQIRSIMTVLNKNTINDISKEILNVVDSSKGESNSDKLQIAWHSLQINVNGLLDSNLLRFSGNYNAKTEQAGLKQLIEKKSGILRQNMMGKRVDYFARTVITPDPLLDIDEIGIPEEFAKKLTYPVPVTPWNVTELRKTVSNGPDVHPGANIIESDDGCMTWIPSNNINRRRGLAKTLLTPGIDSQDPKIVHRHLMNGDVLLINRQPSLHKPSIMAHKARILKNEKTFRLHYANCKAYNADFDGDEMNAHFVQNELSRAEANILANVSNQYLVPRDGTPLSGLIQDHVIAGFRLTVRGKLFNRLEYHQLIYHALCFLVDDIVLLPPCIIKPAMLWSGKQIISTIIINLTPNNKTYLNLKLDSKIGLKAWLKKNNNLVDNIDKDLSEVNVIIRNGELLCGILDKNHVGATHYGLVQSFYELYGGKYSTQLLGAFSKLFTYYLQKDSFTLGVEDILLKNKPDKRRLKIIKKANHIGHEAACNALGVNLDLNFNILQKELEKAYKKHSNFQSYIDREYKLLLDKYTDNINTICLPSGLLRTFPQNNLQLMVQSGAKGSTVNAMQISCLLGQIELEGKRPSLMISGRSLPSFTPYNTSPEAGGFITGRFMTGLQPQEFFFHCMAGREGLIDTAVKTSRSGYLQRCLIKHLEGLVINYDLTVRDSDNSVIQFMYGEDGQDVVKSQLLKTRQLPFIVENIKCIIDSKLVKRLKKQTDNEELAEKKKLIQSWLSQNSYNPKHNNNKSFWQFCRDVKTLNGVVEKKPGRTETATELCNLWVNLNRKTKSRYNACFPQCPDPVNSVLNPNVYFGSVSENVEKMIDNFLSSNDIGIKDSLFRDAIYYKVLTSSCEPGEAVGILAGQSVGEPSTQMTLNTFHFAGRGEMNVTLGIPRLREILMFAAKQIKTPSMEIPFKSNVNKLEKKAEKLRKSLNTLTLKDVLEKITVKESVNLKLHQRQYTLQMDLLPHSLYKDVTNVKPKDIINYLQRDFRKKLDFLFQKHLKLNYGTDLIVQNTGKKSDKSKSADNEEEDDDSLEHYTDNDLPNIATSDEDSDIDGEGDATEMKSRNRNRDINDYDDGDDYISDENELENEDKLGESSAEDSENYLSTGNDSGIGTDNLKHSDEDTETEKKFTNVKVKDSNETFGVKNLKYDEQTFCWCSITCWAPLIYKRLDLSTLLPNLVSASIIHEVSGIKRAITYENNGKLTLKTEGSYGVQKLYRYEPLLDLNKLYSNDIHAIATTYGIEAANRVIVKEIQDVFQVYGINVDPRHLILIADYMTFDGTYKALNRVGMDGCSSPFQQMSFESTLKYLKNAVIHNLKDNAKSPSSSLVVGKEPKIGSGLMKVFHELQ